MQIDFVLLYNMIIYLKVINQFRIYDYAVVPLYFILDFIEGNKMWICS